MQITTNTPGQVTVNNTTPPVQNNDAFTFINWFLIGLPFIMIIVGIVLLAKHKTIAGVIVIGLSLIVPIILFVTASLINTSIQ